MFEASKRGVWSLQTGSLKPEHESVESDDYPDYTREKVMNKETHKNITLITLRPQIDTVARMLNGLRSSLLKKLNGKQ